MANYQSNSPYSRKLIQDEFTDLDVSRQRKHMLRKQKRGVCLICTEPSVKCGLCQRHYLKCANDQRERLRRVFGFTLRKKSKYQRGNV